MGSRFSCVMNVHPSLQETPAGERRHAHHLQRQERAPIEISSDQSSCFRLLKELVSPEAETLEGTTRPHEKAARESGPLRPPLRAVMPGRCPATRSARVECEVLASVSRRPRSRPRPWPDRSPRQRRAPSRCRPESGRSDRSRPHRDGHVPAAPIPSPSVRPAPDRRSESAGDDDRPFDDGGLCRHRSRFPAGCRRSAARAHKSTCVSQRLDDVTAGPTLKEVTEAHGRGPCNRPSGTFSIR